MSVSLMLTILLGLMSLSVVLGVPVSVSKSNRLHARAGAEAESGAKAMGSGNTCALVICNGVWTPVGLSGSWTQGYLPVGVETGYLIGITLSASEMCNMGGGISYRTNSTAVAATDPYYMRCTCPTGGCGAGANPWTNVLVQDQPSGDEGGIQWLNIQCASAASGVFLQGSKDGTTYNDI